MMNRGQSRWKSTIRSAIVSNRDLLGNAIRQLWVLAVIAACSAVAVGQATGQVEEEGTETNAPAQTVAVEGVVDDSAIRTRLTRIYDAAGAAGWLTDTEVIIQSGIVTLRGQADTDEHRKWAENVAQKTEDVVAVVNELKLDDSVDLESTRAVVGTSLQTLWTEFLKRSPLLVAALIILTSSSRAS